MGGAERCLYSFNKIWPDSDIFSLIDTLNNDLRSQIIQGKETSQSFISKLPFAKQNFRYYLPFFPVAVEQHDLREYDVIFSSSYATAKGVLTGQDQLHICYCHSPIRYAWDLYHEYINDYGYGKGIKSAVLRLILSYLRMWDAVSTNRVDYLIANSNFIKQRIWRVYRREAEVIYPPVNTTKFEFKETKENYFYAASRLVPYKRFDLIIEAFKELPEKKLVISGKGPELDKLKKLAGNSKNIELLGYIEQDEMVNLMKNAKAFIFAAKEDFGIIPVEAQACGTPVICYSEGGTKETVINNETGIHFNQQSISSIIEAINFFETKKDFFDPKLIRKNSLRFSEKRFETEIKEYVEKRIDSKTLLLPN